MNIETDAKKLYYTLNKMDNRIKILLDENRSVSSNNKENAIETDFVTKVKLLPDDSLSDTLSLIDQYNYERDNCNLYRLIFTINPVCSNVLFNNKTEVVVNEGSNYCEVIRDPNMYLSKNLYSQKAINTTEQITHIQAIRDTEYSHPENGGFVYHCGVDIFNNHILRNKNFVHVNKIGDDSSVKEMLVYDTIADYLRDSEGNIVKNNLDVSYTGTDKTQLHLYNTDSLLSMKSAFYERCKEKDGWWGFYNLGNININTSSSDTIVVNHVMNNNKPCEFIDLYPDRTLFSFTPKYNKYRRRIEKNWDYCVTYPYKADASMIDRVCGGKGGVIKANIKTVYNINSIQLLQCTSYFKHSFKSGDYVNFYYYEEEPIIPGQEQEEEPERGNMHVKRMYKFEHKVKIYSVGDLNGNFADRIFSVKYSDIDEIYEMLEDNGCFYKKAVNGTECSYYFRKFKKIKNFDGEELKSDINKLAYGENIYGDGISQIVFTDDVDINGLTDENGRQLNELYLTIVKRNKGREEWYRVDNPDISSSAVEFSHCFGKLTSGVDFSGVDVENEPFNYNVHYLHNIEKRQNLISTDRSYANTLSAWGATILNGMPKKIEDNITIDLDEFYGDIVEFDNYNYESTVIGNVFHRFNTEQRESINIGFADIVQDVILYDDYDKYNGSESGKAGFTIGTYYINDFLSGNHLIDNPVSSNTLVRGNIMPEGYFYNPNYKIKIKEEEELPHQSAAKLINYDDCSISGRVVYLEFEVSFVNGERVYTLVGKRYDNPYGGNSTGRNDRSNDRSSHPIGYGNEVAHVFSAVTEGYTLKVHVPTNYGFYKGDYVALYDKQTNTTYWGEIINFTNMELSVFLEGSIFDGLNVTSNIDYFTPESLTRRFYMFWSPDSVPTYSKLCIESMKFCWKRLMNMSELTGDSDLSETPFSNGRHYIHQNINFFLKRQDPNGEYGLSEPITHEIDKPIPNPMTKYTINGYEPIAIDFGGLLDIIKDTKTCY